MDVFEPAEQTLALSCPQNFDICDEDVMRKDDVQCGRPPTYTIDENMKHMGKIVQVDPRMSVRMISETNNINEERHHVDNFAGGSRHEISLY